MGKESLFVWLSLLAVFMNLFVLKQITLFGLHVTASDALSVGYLLGLNLIQEFFGTKQARKSIWISFFSSILFLVLSSIHLAYRPNEFDHTQEHFIVLLASMPRFILASLTSFLIVQLIDLAFFSFLKEKLQGKYLTLRMIAALILFQSLDTILFSYLGLYGLVASIRDVIFLSLFVKGILILCTTPFVAFSKRLIHDV